MIYNKTLSDNGKIWNSCTIYIVLLVTVFLKIFGMSSAYFYFQWYLKRSDTNITNINANTETVTY